MRRLIRSWPLFAIGIATSLAAAPGAAAGQGVALEGGGTYLENREETVLSWGAALYVPTGERTIAALHYVQWEGAEGDGTLARCGADGCRGGGMHLLYRVLGSTSYGWFLGGGLDLYEHLQPTGLEDDFEREYHGAVSGATMVARGVSDSVSLYARAVVSAHAFDFDLRTAYLHAGIVVRLF